MTRQITIEELFDVLDADGDGSLTREEIIAGAHKINLTKKQASDIFDEMDTNGDGTLSKMEFYFAPEEIDDALTHFNGDMEEIEKAKNRAKGDVAKKKNDTFAIKPKVKFNVLGWSQSCCPTCGSPIARTAQLGHALSLQ